MLLISPKLASADDEVAAQLQAMQERMNQLEQRLEATSDELAVANARVDEQHQLIESSGIAEGSANISGLSSFLENIELGGWISGSYVYNFEGTDGILSAERTPDPACCLSRATATASSFGLERQLLAVAGPGERDPFLSGSGYRLEQQQGGDLVSRLERRDPGRLLRGRLRLGRPAGRAPTFPRATRS